MSNNGYDCLETGKFTGYRNSEVAIVSQSAAFELRLNDLRLADNGMGTSFLIAYEAVDMPLITVTGALYIGESLHMYCDPSNCGGADCVATYGAVLGTFLTGPGQTVTLDSHINQPFGFPHHPSAWQGEHHFRSTTFMEFKKDNDCTIQHTAVVTNVHVSDRIHDSRFSATSLLNVDTVNSIVWIFDPNYDWAREGMCGQFECTGQENVLIIDEDGSLSNFGVPHGIISHNKNIASKG